MNTVEAPKPEIRGLALWAVYTFKFFASLRLAILILVTLILVLAAGTIIESSYGTDAARLLIYQTPWFGGILLVLAINLAAAALDRIPWKKKHIGFVMTHAGIILILFGSWMTQKMMIDGQMSIAEGETSYKITLPEPLLYIYSKQQQKTWYVDLKKHALAWNGKQALWEGNDGEPLPFEITQLAFYPKAEFREEIVGAGFKPAPTADSQSVPAIKIRLKNSFVEEHQWLMRDDPQKGQTQMGPVKLRFTKEELPPAATGSEDMLYLEFQFSDSHKNPVTVALDSSIKLPFEKKLEGTPYKIKITRVLREAMVDGKRLVEMAADPKLPAKNPAVEFFLIGPDFEEKHTAFAKFPDFPTAHGMKPSASGMRIFYRLPGAGSKGETHEIRFVETNGKLICQIQKGMRVTSQEIEKAQEIQTGWMGGLTVLVEEFFPHAQLKTVVTPASNLSENPEHLSAIQVDIPIFRRASSVIARPKAEAISEFGDRHVPPSAGLAMTVEGDGIWLRQGIRQEFETPSGKWLLVYGEKIMPAPFKLTLKDFRLQNYPGTSQPASFESDVILKDDIRGIVREETISMNKPLVYRGYRIYQSGYSIPSATEPSADGSMAEISIFSVGKDPGVPVKYAGAIVMIAGILIMFYTRRFSTSTKAL